MNASWPRVTHICPVAGCSEPVASDKLMCWEHWRRVPVVLQRMIYRLWNNGTPLAGHSEACESAIEQVNEALEGRR